MIVRSSLLLVLLVSAAACSKSAPPPTTTTPATSAPTTPAAKLSADAFRGDRVQTGDGPIAKDDGPDAAVEVFVGGPIKAIGLLSVDAAGKPFDGQQWDTWVGATPMPAALGVGFGTGGETWQLGVVENGALKNAADGSLAALPDGAHTLTIYAADSGQFVAERRFAVFVERPNGTIDHSNVFQILLPPPK